MSPPRKDPIPNQYSTRIITQQDPILLPLLSNWPTGYKPFFDDKLFSDKKKDERNDSSDNSRTDSKDSLNNLNAKTMKIRMVNTKKIIQKILKVIKV